ncbi:siderophore-interacting protein [Glaciimonas soli]|uniref:Siderophore-interacting protein n=1 Tax=Glaciimonas soli TaxID=2590999 RepID=A0A843YXA5_9BURK|nr:siderophore-interacting protein [Glaciimonas soli]MQR01842.1 siderophore-interacting protein [Glaciimonas soli]
MIIDRTVGRVQRVRHELKFRDLQVVRVASVSPHFRSVTFSGAALNDFISASFDDHIKLILNPDTDAMVRRDYTPRSYDAATGELTLEFAIHDNNGPAASWAAQATVGQRATIAGPRGSFVIPLDYDWHLLTGDETALPAIVRRLEELPASAHAIVVLMVPDVSDRRTLHSAASLDIHWVNDAEQWIAAVRALTLPTGDGYTWCAGEANTVATLRRVLVEEKGVARHAIRAAAYWKRGAIAHHENLED